MPTPNTLLKRERQLRGWSQGYLAEHIGVQDYYISRWERGEVFPSPYYQQKLCELFGKTAEELGLLQTKKDIPQQKQEGRAAKKDTSPLPSVPPILQDLPTSTFTLLDEPITDKHEVVSVMAPSSIGSEMKQDDSEQPPAPPSPPAQLEIGGVIASQPTPQAGPKTSRQHLLSLILLVALLAVLLFGGGGFLLVRSTSSVVSLPPSMVGHFYFLSSGQISSANNRGIADQVSVQIHMLGRPASGKSDYAWLLPDEQYPENPIFPLGTLTIHGNIGSLSYNDPDHTNLLALTSRFLVTEEDASVVPVSPSVDTRTWRYMAQVPHQVATGQSYSFLDHLRHLLAADPKLHAHQLSGGLTPWLYRNLQAAYAQAINAKELWQANQMTNQGLIKHSILPILYYLEGAPFLQQDLPGVSSPLSLSLDPKTVNVGLLQMYAQQDPPGYLDHITLHLTGLSSSPGTTAPLREQIASIMIAINTVNFWLHQARQDINQLIDQPLQPSQVTMLLNDLVTQMSNAFLGRQDAVTGRTQEGVEWITQAIEGLATVEIKPYPIEN